MTESTPSNVTELRQWSMRHFQRNPPRKFESVPELEPLAVVFIFLCTSAQTCPASVMEPYANFVHTLMLQYKKLVRARSLAVHERIRDDPTYEPFPISKLQLLFVHSIDDHGVLRFRFLIHPGAQSAMYTDNCDMHSWTMIMRSVEQHSNASTVNIQGLMLDEEECVFDKNAFWFASPVAKDLVTTYETGVGAIREMVLKGHTGVDYGLESVTLADECFFYLCQYRLIQLVEHTRKKNASEADRKAVAAMYLHAHYYGALAFYFANRPNDADIYMQWAEDGVYCLKKRPGITLMKFALLWAYINELGGFKQNRKVKRLLLMAVEENEKGKFINKDLLDHELNKL